MADVCSCDAKAFSCVTQLWPSLQYGLLTAHEGYIQIIIDNLEGAVAFLDTTKSISGADITLECLEGFAQGCPFVA